MDLDISNAHRLQAAIGWLELGLPAEARAELDQLPLEAQHQPQLLELRWMIEARLQEWPKALAAAEKLMAARPDDAASWLHLAYALRRVPEGGLERAQTALRPAFEKFPAEATIPYNLACYACQLGKLEEARAWLARAIERGGRKHIREMALRDSDLLPLWDEIGRAE